MEKQRAGIHGRECRRGFPLFAYHYESVFNSLDSYFPTIFIELKKSLIIQYFLWLFWGSAIILGFLSVTIASTVLAFAATSTFTTFTITIVVIELPVATIATYPIS